MAKKYLKIVASNEFIVSTKSFFFSSIIYSFIHLFSKKVQSPIIFLTFIYLE